MRAIEKRPQILAKMREHYIRPSVRDARIWQIVQEEGFFDDLA
jgi:hypothetical protein